MAQFTRENAAEHGRRGGQQSYSHQEQQYAQLVLKAPAKAQRVAQLIAQGFRLALALRSVELSDQLERKGT
jgi:hypothetical protein